MIHTTLSFLNVLNSNKKISLIGQGWGSYILLLYQNRHPLVVKNIILLDVGIKKLLSLRDLIYILVHHFFIILIYIISQVLNIDIADIVLNIYVMISNQIVSNNNNNHNNTSDLCRKGASASKCYIYYHFWKSFMFSHFLDPKFPTCPLLYLV